MFIRMSVEFVFRLEYREGGFRVIRSFGSRSDLLILEEFYAELLYVRYRFSVDSMRKLFVKERERILMKYRVNGKLIRSDLLKLNDYVRYMVRRRRVLYRRKYVKNGRERC